MKVLNAAKQCPYSEIYVAGNNKTFLRLRVKCPLYLSDCYQIWSFSTDFRKIPRIKFTDILLVGAALMHLEGQTDGHDEDNRRFSRLYERAYKSATKHTHLFDRITVFAVDIST
jgi:hypothetical protein